jgi:tetratricopeptide (TPR) repeat protein
MTLARPLPTRFIIAGALVVCAGIGAGWYFLRGPDRTNDRQTSQHDPSDPRLAYDGPFRNVHPDVGFVGSASCAACHPDIARSYARHPMGRSLAPVSGQPVGDLADRGHATFDALGSTFRVERDGSRLRYTETRAGPGGKPLFEMGSALDYVIGSGSKGHSFLCERDGFVTQAPVSWFAQKRLWDESPGFPPEFHAGRPVQVGCLYCHANDVSPVAGTVNRYEPPVFRHGHAIGCERCHGPGAEHVRQREAGGATGGPDHTIVNPRHLAPALREAVCQQCHLAGEARVVREGRALTDFRPGLPLDAVIRVLVRDHRGTDRKAVNHVEQMYLSKCYAGSGGALGCTTCHDPHDKPHADQRAARYRAACLKCHDCSAPLAVRTANGAADNCAGCHMPRFTAGDIAHAATTDHRIVRPAAAAKPGGASRAAGGGPLLFFPARVPDPRSGDEVRDYAVGLVELARQGREPAAAVARDALPLLERAIAARPGDYRAWDAKSYALRYAGLTTEAFAAAQTALNLFPGYEAGLVHAAELAVAAGRPDEARDYRRRAVALNPHSAAYRQDLAEALAKGGDWPAARAEAEEAVRLDPARATARTVLAIALARAGERAKAEDEFRTVEALKPPNLGELRKWYAAERPRP